MLDKVVIESLAARIRREFEFQLEKFGEVLSNLPLWTCAAALAYHGLLGPVNAMWLDENYFDFALSKIPEQHLTALVSCVTGIVIIRDFSDCDLVTILDSIKSKSLNIFQSRRLGREETRALVRAMETRVERVELEVDSFDAETLVEYSGQGRCWECSATCTSEMESIPAVGTLRRHCPN